MIHPKSKLTYEASAAKFVHWVYVNKREALTTAFTELATSKILPEENCTVKTIRSCFQRLDILPFDFENLDPTLFLMWLLTLRTNSGGHPTSSTYSGHRSGLNNLFRMYKQQKPNNFEKEMGNLFHGLTRTATERQVRGESRVKTGKDRQILLYNHHPLIYFFRVKSKVHSFTIIYFI